MKSYIVVGILVFMVLDDTSSSPMSNWNIPSIKDGKNVQPYAARDYWSSNNILSDYGIDNPFKQRLYNERLRQHYKMRNGKNSPFYQSGRAFYMQNTNPIDMIGNDLNSLGDNKDEKINYDSNTEEADELDDGLWSNTKWTN